MNRIVVSEAPGHRTEWPRGVKRILIMYFRSDKTGNYRVIREPIVRRPSGPTKYEIANHHMRAAAAVAPSFKLAFVAVATKRGMFG